MKMKASSLRVICLALFLLHLHFSEGRGGRGKSSRPSSSGSSSSSKSSSSSSSSSTSSSSSGSNSGTSSNKANSNKPSQTNHGYGHPQPGWHGNTNPSWNSPNKRGHGTHGGYGGHQGGYGGNQGGYGGHQGGYGGHQGGYGAGQGAGYGGYSYGGYQGGYINRNPANRIASPHYSDSASYGGYNNGRGSPFSQSVQNSGRFPTDESRGFGRKAVLAAAGGATGGMAMGYGLGRMHRPDYQLNSPQEEYYYNHYMYKKHGTKTEVNRANRGSSDNNVNEEYTSSNNEAPMTYDGYMEKCMIGLQRDQVKIMEQSDKPTIATTTTARTTRSVTPSSASDAAGSNKTALNESTPSLSIAPGLSKTPDDEKTVSIVEIGYPALIYQHNVKTCMERFFAYSEFIKGGAQGIGTGSPRFVALASSVMLMLFNSNLHVLLFSW